VKYLTYGVGMTIMYDLKKQKGELLKFYAESDVQKSKKDRRMLHKTKHEELNFVVEERIHQHCSELMPLNGNLIMKQAKMYHHELKIEGNCKYSTHWLQKLKKKYSVNF
jgi:hypothetical protein